MRQGGVALTERVNEPPYAFGSDNDDLLGEQRE
jgi:hypothetical protein